MLHLRKKIFFSALFLFVFSGIFFIQETSLAQVIDQKCFTRAQCDDARRAIGGGEGDGFYTGKKETIQACGEKTPTGDALGFCLPAGKTVTNIAFGGKKEFANLGEFIQYMYRYGIIFAGVLAVIMIIVAGLQWTASGGNSSTIESAKKRIAGAITGLILASTSYIILNTLNPNMVNLRLPQVWLINSVSLFPSMCREAEDGTQLALAAKADEIITPKEQEDRLSKVTTWFKKEKNSKIDCGNKYFLFGYGSMACNGDSCPTGNVCIPKDDIGYSYKCADGVIAGKIFHSGFIANVMDNVPGRVANEGWSWGGHQNIPGWVVGPRISKDAIQLEAVCMDGNFENNLGNVHIDTIQRNEEKKTQNYILKVSDLEAEIAKSKNDCNDNGGLRGFVMETQFNEAGDLTYENHYLGRTGLTAVDLGDDGAEDVTLATNLTNPYVITEEDLRKGIIIDIDAAKIHDIDEDADRSVYAPYGYITDNAKSKKAQQEALARRAARQAQLDANPAAAADAQHEEDRPVPN